MATRQLKIISLDDGKFTVVLTYDDATRRAQSVTITNLGARAGQFAARVRGGTQYVARQNFTGVRTINLPNILLPVVDGEIVLNLDVEAGF